MEPLYSIVEFILHVDQYLVDICNSYKTWTYLILFLIIFAETGLVVTPFLPGDSLLFAAGAIVAKPESGLDIFVLSAILIVAAILGDMTNYHIGKYIGPRAFSGKYKFLNVKYLEKTQRFYNTYGGKTIIYARFVPIVRTFAPFVAGIGTMSYQRFAYFNIIGALVWVLSFLFLGFFFGGLPIIKNNFTYVIFAIIFFSILPPLFELGKKALTSRKRIVNGSDF